MKLKLLEIRTYGFYGQEDSEYLLVSVENGKEELLEYLSKEEGFNDWQIEEMRKNIENSEDLDLQFERYSRDCIIDLGEIKDLRINKEKKL